MGDGKLVFQRPADGSGRLVFGDVGGEPEIPGVELSIDATFARDFEGGTLRTGSALVVDAVFADDFNASVELEWDANVSRVQRAELGSAWQQAQPTQSATRAHWQRSQPLQVGLRARFQEAQPLHASVQQRWQATLALRSAVRSGWEEAEQLHAAAQQRWQEAMRLRAAVASVWQQGHAVRSVQRHHWEETLRLRHAARQHWQGGAPVRAISGAQWGPGLPVFVRQVQHWQEAMRPPPGMYVPPPVTDKHICYDPTTLGRLVFEDVWGDSGKLVFVCRHKGSDPEAPVAVIVVPRRRSYVVNNTISCTRVDGDEVIPIIAGSFTMEIDYRSWTWGYSFTTLKLVRPLLAQTPGQPPVELEVMVNGVPYRLRVDSISRGVSHPVATIKVSGLSNASMLGEPNALEQSFAQSELRTARQLMEDVLTVNGVSNGWGLDWQLTDWPVAAGTWSHHGTWISAINDIAAAVDAYVQPHDTADVLRILPRWPVRSWELAGATPDIELPPGIASTENTEWVSKPAYEAIYMRGVPGDKLYHRYRDGTPGVVLAPLATHALLVHSDAAAQRAIADLSEGGEQVWYDLTLGVLPATGIIKPGKLLRYTDDDAEVRTGVVRGVRVADDAEAALRQTIRLETRL